MHYILLMNNLFPSSYPTFKPSTSFFNNHPDTKQGSIISFAVLASGILFLILISYFFCKKNVNYNSTNLQCVSSQV